MQHNGLILERFMLKYEGVGCHHDCSLGDDSAKSETCSLHRGVRLNSPRAEPAPELVPEHVAAQ